MLNLYLIAAVAIIALVDYFPKVINALKKPTSVKTGYDRKPKYLIMPTVYGDIKYLDNISFLKKYPNNVLICTSDHETDKFYADLRRVCKQYGFRYCVAKVPVVKGQPLKNAYSIYKAIFTRKHLPMAKNTPCLLIDADTYAVKNVNNLIRSFKSSGADMASMRCEVATEGTVIQQLQGFEYRLAMDNRRMDPWLTSGACNLAYAGVYRDIFAKHSDFFAGGDIEIGKLAYTSGRSVKHLGFTFYTDAPDTFKNWFKQRTIWFAGGFRHYIMSMDRFGWHHFFLLFYNALLIYLLFPIRWMEIIEFPALMAILLVVSWVYIFALTIGKGWKPVYLLMPFYSFIQTMIIVPFGVARYITISAKSRSLGRIGSVAHLSYSGLSAKAVTTTLNLATAAIVLWFAYAIFIARIEFWALN